MVLRDEIKHAAHIVIVGARSASVQGDTGIPEAFST